MISKALHSKSVDFRWHAKFQSRVVHEWNPKSKDATAFIVQPVSLCDEIKTDGYGMSMIEFLYLLGILNKVLVDGDNTTGTVVWQLGDN